MSRTYAGRHRPAPTTRAEMRNGRGRHAADSYSAFGELGQIVAAATGPAGRTSGIVLASGALIATVAVPSYAAGQTTNLSMSLASGALAVSAPAGAAAPVVGAPTFSAAPVPAGDPEVVEIAQSPIPASTPGGFGTSFPVIDTPRANPRAAADAVAWAKSQTGRGGWYRQCLAFVARAYGWNMSGMSTALAQYRALPAEMRHDGDRTPPVGALLFWTTGSSAGHVAIYLGNGQIASNDIVQAGVISVVPATQIEAKWTGSRYLGWTMPYFASAS